MATHTSMCLRLFDRFYCPRNLRKALFTNWTIQRLHSNATHEENEFELGHPTISARNFASSLKTQSRKVTDKKLLMRNAGYFTVSV